MINTMTLASPLYQAQTAINMPDMRCTWAGAFQPLIDRVGGEMLGLIIGLAILLLITGVLLFLLPGRDSSKRGAQMFFRSLGVIIVVPSLGAIVGAILIQSC